MKIETVANDRLRVWLSDRELSGAGIRLPALRAGDPAVHRLLRRVMTAAKRRMPALRARRCAAELIPVDGGCVLKCIVADKNAVFRSGRTLQGFASYPVYIAKDTIV